MKKIIVKISNGIGNQMFMYANAFSLSKKLNYELYIDKQTGFKNEYLKNFQPYQLDNFNITAKEDKSFYSSTNFFPNFKKKMLKKIDIFFNKKSFVYEIKDKKNIFIHYTDLKESHYSDTVYIDGYFQSEKYFKEHKNLILNEFSFKNINISEINFDLNLLKKKNSVSIAVRTNRFNERSKDDLSNPKKILRSDLFLKETIKYIYNAVDFFKKKIDQPSFFVWSNDINHIKKYFNNDFMFVDIKKNKIINDLYTMSLCNNFIIGPTTFHWWGAYLAKNNHKICILPPKHLPFSSNLDIYPETWIKF